MPIYSGEYNVNMEDRNAGNPYDRSSAYYSTVLQSQEMREAALYGALSEDRRASSLLPGVRRGSRGELYTSMMANSAPVARYFGGSYVDMSAGFSDATRAMPGMGAQFGSSVVLGGQLASVVQQDMFNEGRALYAANGMDRSEVGQAAAIFGAQGGLNNFSKDLVSVDADNSREGIEKLKRTTERLKKGTKAREQIEGVLKEFEDAAKMGQSMSISTTVFGGDAERQISKTFQSFTKALKTAANVLQTGDLQEASQLVQRMSGTNVAMSSEDAYAISRKLGRIQNLGSTGVADSRVILQDQMAATNMGKQAFGAENLANAVGDIGSVSGAIVQSDAKLGGRGVRVADKKEIAAVYMANMAETLNTSGSRLSAVAYWRENSATDSGKKKYEEYMQRLQQAKTQEESSKITTEFIADVNGDDSLSSGGNISAIIDSGVSGVAGAQKLGVEGSEYLRDMANVEGRIKTQTVNNRTLRRYMQNKYTKADHVEENVGDLSSALADVSSVFTANTSSEFFAANRDHDVNKMTQLLKDAGVTDKDQAERVIKSASRANEMMGEKNIKKYLQEQVSSPKHNTGIYSLEAWNANARQTTNAEVAIATQVGDKMRKQGGVKGFVQGLVEQGQTASREELIAMTASKKSSAFVKRNDGTYEFTGSGVPPELMKELRIKAGQHLNDKDFRKVMDKLEESGYSMAVKGERTTSQLFATRGNIGGPSGENKIHNEKDALQLAKDMAGGKEIEAPTSFGAGLHLSGNDFLSRAGVKGGFGNNITKENAAKQYLKIAKEKGLDLASWDEEKGKFVIQKDSLLVKQGVAKAGEEVGGWGMYKRLKKLHEKAAENGGVIKDGTHYAILPESSLAAGVNADEQEGGLTREQFTDTAKRIGGKGDLQLATQDKNTGEYIVSADSLLTQEKFGGYKAGQRISTKEMLKAAKKLGESGFDTIGAQDSGVEFALVKDSDIEITKENMQRKLGDEYQGNKFISRFMESATDAEQQEQLEALFEDTSSEDIKKLGGEAKLLDPTKHGGKTAFRVRQATQRYAKSQMAILQDEDSSEDEKKAAYEHLRKARSYLRHSSTKQPEDPLTGEKKNADGTPATGEEEGGEKGGEVDDGKDLTHIEGLLEEIVKSIKDYSHN